jgi:hypothetical protein
MQKLEKLIYVCAGVVIVIIGANTNFSNKFFDLVGAASGASVTLGIFAAALALLWRRARIRRNRSLYGEKAEIIERSVDETLIAVAKGVIGLWLLIVVVGALELLRQTP